MDVREKLVELLSQKLLNFEKATYLADYLINNGVTVQDGKPLDAFLHPVDAYKGLKAKYLVFKADTGERVGNCFVLRPDKDPAALEAIRAYASATYNETLAEDIYNWVGKGEPAQEWISVEDRLPDKPMKCIVYTKRGDCGGYEITYYNQGFYLQYSNVTHWMPLPEPSEGE